MHSISVTTLIDENIFNVLNIRTSYESDKKHRDKQSQAILKLAVSISANLANIVTGVKTKKAVILATS